MATLSVQTSHNDLRPQDASAVRSHSPGRSPVRSPDNAGSKPEKKHDQYVMDSNNSSIVSKRSVEKLYYAGEPEYFRHFVSKFKRRSPLINRGYWLRMKAVEHAVTRFLAEQTSKRKVVVNLGCGYDPLPFMLLGKHSDLCENTAFVDVDFPVLMQNKCGIIDKTERLSGLLSQFARTTNEDGVLGAGEPYVAIGCDLRDIDRLKAVLQENLEIEDNDCAILFVAEVSIAYMEREASQAIVEWAATYQDVRFCLLEQHLPDGADHPFARTMLSHFSKLRTPLHTIGTMDEMKKRFSSAGWPEPAMEMHTLWELWSEPTFLAAEQRRSLDAVEPFDEWEEFALFASHYFLLVAERKADQDYTFKSQRASLAANRLSVLPGNFTDIGSSSAPEIEPEQKLYAKEFPGNQVPRRFGALIPPSLRGQDGDAIGLHGGLGTNERLGDCDTYSWFETAQSIGGPPLRQGLMCHTTTRLGGTSNCMLVGGRTSPDRALSDCWLRSEGEWSKVHDLPEGRYRHCAVALRLPTEPRPAHTVMIYGGKSSDGHVLDEWLLWTGDSGWQNLRVVGDHPCGRFGAAMISDKAEGISGVIIGGMTSAGRVLNDFWHWNLQPDMSVTCQNVTQRAVGVLKNNASILGRFGAQLVRSEYGILQLGGVAGGRMLTRHEEVLNMRTLRPFAIKNARPLFVGASVQDVSDGLLLLGGGATCFSFGTYWCKSCMLTNTKHSTKAPSEDMTWQLISSRQNQISRQSVFVNNRMSTVSAMGDMPSPGLPPPMPPPPLPGASPQMGTINSAPNSAVETPQSARGFSNAPAAPQIAINEPGSAVETNGHTPALPTPLTVPSVYLKAKNEFMKYLDAASPVILSGLNVGTCTQYWTNEYLKEAVGVDRPVTVHSSQDDMMDFQNKNFSYVSQEFGSFLDAAQDGEKVYLRSLSKDAPSEKPANLADDFPEIATDFKLPDELAYVVSNAHSTPLRISGPVKMWLHYDVMANVLCQVRGEKKVLLFPPSDVKHLGIEAGASSSSIDVFSANMSQHPSLRKTNPQEATLAPGDILFIPATWVHTAAPTEGMSISVNCFFRSLENQKYAAGRDVYGNRDLAAYEKGRKDVAKIIKSFDNLPPHVSAFYLQRLGMELLEKAKVTSASAGEQLHSTYAELGP